MPAGDYKGIPLRWSHPKDAEPLDAPMTYTVRPWLDPEQFHSVTVSGAEIFLDYFKLKGVTSMNVDVHAGDVVRMTVEFMISSVVFNESEKK